VLKTTGYLCSRAGEICRDASAFSPRERALVETVRSVVRPRRAGPNVRKLARQFDPKLTRQFGPKLARQFDPKAGPAVWPKS
jgi:hypothetical protein